MFQEIYVQKTKKSKALYERASKAMPGGVSGGGKFLKPYPLYIKSAKGSKIVDVDGNEYVDFLIGSGPNILGHSPAVVIEAVERYLNEGILFFLSNELEIELAEKIIHHVPSIEMLRFLNTGTESSFMAIRVARAYTKRDKIAKFEGHYHGQHDYVLISSALSGGLPYRAGPKENPSKTLDCAGIPKEILNTVEVLPFNDIETTEALIRKYTKELAAVIIEPVMGPGGTVPADKEFLKAVREITEEREIILIFDEVFTGFRQGMGGAQEYYGVTPDLTILGKIVGGGFPIGVYGGRKDIMERVVTPTKDLIIDIETKVYSSGTYTGNPISMAAGLATLKELEKGKVHPYINRLGEIMRKKLKEVSLDVGIELQVTGLGPFFATHFTGRQIRNVRDVARADSAKRAEFHLGMVGKGVYFDPGGSTISSAHEERDIEKSLRVAEEVLRVMRVKSK